jgi:hypothetical protein
VRAQALYQALYRALCRALYRALYRALCRALYRCRSSVDPSGGAVRKGRIVTPAAVRT